MVDSLGVLNIIVNKAYNVLHSGQVLAHIWNFNVRNCSARRNFLELAFKLEFGERVDILAYVNVITVGIIAFVGYVLDSAEALFIYSRKAVAKAFRRSAVKPEAKPRFLLPLLAVFAQNRILRTYRFA